MAKALTHVSLIALLALLSTQKVSANALLHPPPSEGDTLSVKNQGYMVVIVKGLLGSFDYFKFGENDQFILGSEVRNGTGTYTTVDNVYFNAQFNGSSNGEDFSYIFNGLNLWGIVIWGEGVHTRGSTVEELTFTGITSFLISPFAEKP